MISTELRTLSNMYIGDLTGTTAIQVRTEACNAFTEDSIALA
jgi:hypothetical protein